MKNKFLLSVFFLFSIFSVGVLEYSTFAMQEEVVEQYDIEYHKLDVQDLYKNAYKKLSMTEYAQQDSLLGKAIFATAKSMGITPDLLQNMLLENPERQRSNCPDGKDSVECITTLLKKHCPNEYSLTNRFVECQIEIKNRVIQEYEIAQFENDLHGYSLASQAFLNGTLQDTGKNSFDIIVDLNIIDLLIFGNKMTIPKTGSPFLPTFPFSEDEKNANDDEKNEYNDNSDFNNGWSNDIENEEGEDNNENEDNDNNDNNDNNENDKNDEQNESEGFCIDPDSLLFSGIITSQYLGVNRTDSSIVVVDNDGSSSSSSSSSENSAYSAIQMGNIIPEYIKYSGGKYPDIRHLSGTKKCENGEQSFFQGRVCIPEFCTELICITINFEMEKERLQKLDCVECHIDRGNEALNPFIATLGQNTPNQNPQESFFLSAFANLFKGVTKSITLKPKRLPFLIYDKSLSDQKKEKDEKNLKSQSPQIPEDSKEPEEIESPQYLINKKLYDEMLLGDCPELFENFTPGEGYLKQQTEYCGTLNRDSSAIYGSFLRQNEKGNVTNSQIAQKSKGRSDTYHTVVQPFFWQMSKDMVLINNHLEDIIPKNIQKTAQNCKQVIN